MNKSFELAHMSSLIDPLAELAAEIDGVADFGMAVCFAKEDEMAGRHLYISQQFEKIQLLVESIFSSLNGAKPLCLKELPALQADLLSGKEQFLNSFRSLENFRTLSPDCLRSSVEALRTGWETLHGVILGIANALDIIDQSWYSPILERQESYRSQLERVGSCFCEQ